MPSIGSLFPREVRDDFVNRTILPGSVLRIHVTNTNPPKIKRFVVLSTCDHKVCVGYLFINSEINPNCFPNQKLRDLHLPLSIDECDFLDHDSFLDCSDIKEIEVEKLTEIISRDPSRHIGHLPSSYLQRAIETVKSAPTITKKTKRKFNII